MLYAAFALLACLSFLCGVGFARWQRKDAAILVPKDDLYQRAVLLAKEWDSKLESGFGEAKRHGVYSQLIKEFPATSKHQIADAIQAAVPR